MTGTKKERFKLWREQHEGAWQFIMYLLVGCLTTIVELGSFALLNFWLLVPFRDRTFSWWIIDYSVENGGLTAFLALAVSFAISQVFNFITQRKVTFKANNNVAKSAIIYAITVIGLYFLQLYLPTLVRAQVVAALGAVIGDLLIKVAAMTMTMMVQFLASKWFIMRRV